MILGLKHHRIGDRTTKDTIDTQLTDNDLTDAPRPTGPANNGFAPLNP